MKQKEGFNKMQAKRMQGICLSNYSECRQTISKCKSNGGEQVKEEFVVTQTSQDVSSKSNEACDWVEQQGNSKKFIQL
ncbi:unnamed protein product [Paramecium octaurelia]|uniref:Uncharacterized protein n=1 Tax=Paramecium octaurelia TaxID=43137 RepID=A0A8S1XMT7_PAROT|nr:unnamed protein product [Paramecium octaurelia]